MHADRPSLTALKVARAVMSLDTRPELARLLPPDAAHVTRDLLKAGGLLPAWQEKVIGHPRMRDLAEAIEAHTAPGTTVMIGLRKRFFDDEAAAAIADGAEELIVVGAGYDSLGLRLARKHPHLRVIELDHPATSRIKRRAVERLGSPPNLSLIAADLSLRSLTTVLAAVDAHRAEAPAFVVAEGLLMYLRAADVLTLFERLRQSVGPGSRVGFSYLEEATLTRQLGRLHRLTMAGFQLIGEPLHWTVREGDLAAFLAPTGWRYEPDPRFEVGHYLEGTSLAGQPTGVERVAVVT